MRIELTYTPDCPNVATVRERLRAALRRADLPATVDERQDSTRPSPAVSVDRVDVLGAPTAPGRACRLDLPTEDDLVRAFGGHTADRAAHAERPAERIADIPGTPLSPGAEFRWLWPALLRRLAAGSPVTLDDLAEATGRGVAEVRRALAALPDTEYDDRGRVVGHGLTLRPTPHRFTVDGRRLYTWCALDTLAFPTVLGRPAAVASPTPGTGDLVTLDVDPSTGVSALQPATAVVSVVVPEQCTSVRSAFCEQVHYFATRDTAERWLAEHPSGRILSVEEAFDMGQCMVRELRGDEPRCCGP